MSKKEEKKESKKTFDINALVIKYFKIILVAGAIIGIVASYFLMIGPQRSKAHLVSKQDLKPLQDEHATKSSILNSLQARTKNFEFVKNQRLETLVELLPSVDQKDDLYHIVHDVITGQGLTLSKLAIDTPKSLGTYVVSGSGKLFADLFADLDLPIMVVPIGIEISENGAVPSYEQIKKFLNGLYLQQRIFSIGSLTLGTTGEDEVSNEQGGSMEMQFDTFFIKLEN